MPDSSDMRRQVTALARDRVSGATALARRAVRLLQAAARDDGKSVARWQQELRAVGSAIVAAQPAMASLVTVVDVAVGAAHGARTPAAGAAAVRRALEAFRRRQPAAVARAARRVPALLPPDATCLTLSSSEVVHGALVAARRHGRLAHVIVAESRPGCEGVSLARRLAAAGIRVTLVVDALAPSLVADVDAVVVGADAVTARAVWNKCGTLALALAARAAGRPLVVATTDDRLLRRDLARGLQVPTAEPWVRARGVRTLNRLFDATPLRLVRWVVTESGARSAVHVRRRLSVQRTR